MKFTEEMFACDQGDGVSVGELSGRIRDHVDVFLGIIDSTLGMKSDPILGLNEVDFVDVDNNWTLEYFDGVDPWIRVSKWVDFVDPDGDSHHGRLNRCWDPDNPANIEYYLEVDILSER